MTQYTVAVLGCGPRGDDHIWGFLSNPERFHLVGICDKDKERLQRISAKYPIEALYTDGDQMLSETKPDIFCFATLPAIRLPLIEMGLRHGVKAIAYEKPMALSLQEAHAITEKCRAAGVKTILAHAQKYGNHWLTVKEIVDRGDIGTVHTIHATAQAWLMQLGTHLIDYALWYNGYSPIDWVIGQAHGKGKLEDTHRSPEYVFAQLGFQNGVRGVIECGPQAPSFMDEAHFWVDDTVTLYGSHGYARVITGNGWEAVTRHSGGRILKGPGKYFPLWDQPPYQRELADWLDSPAKSHCCNGEISYHGYQAAMAICISSIERRLVKLPLETIPEYDVFDKLGEVLPD